MMGRETPPKAAFVYTGITLGKGVRGGHVLRKVARRVDFVFADVKDSYGYNGNVSPPPMILLMPYRQR